MVTGAEKLPLPLTVACTQSPSPILGVPTVRQSRKIACDGSVSVPVMVCNPAARLAGLLTVTVSGGGGVAVPQTADEAEALRAPDLLAERCRRHRAAVDRCSGDIKI